MTGSKGQFITAFQISVSLGLTLLIGFLIYRSVPDWGQAWSVMISGRPGYLLAGIGFIMLHMLLRAMRWGILLSPVKPKISLRRLFSLTMVKYVINVIPPRAGEVAGSLLLAKKEDVSATSVIATSVLERILDLLAVLVIFGFYAAFYSHLYVPETTGGREIMLNVRGYSVKIFVLLCLGISLFAYVILHPQWINRFPAWLQRFLGRFLDGCQSLREGHALLKIGGLSIAIWLTITMQLWCMVVAYLNDFPLSGTLLLVSLTVVGVAIPTPGGVGGFQFFMNLALVNFFSPYLSGHDPYSQAAGVSNGCYVVSMIPLMVVGILCLNREGISLGRISKMSREFQTDDNDRGAAGTDQANHRATMTSMSVFTFIDYPRRWIRSLYDWTMHWAETPQSMIALLLIAFAESSVFPIPPDVLLIAIVAANPSRWLQAATLCAMGSLLGAALGYAIGNVFMAAAGQPIIDFYHAQEHWNTVVQMYTGSWGVWFLAAAAFSPIPFKVATIAAGATGMSFWPFLFVSLLGRSARFYLVASLLRVFGAPIRHTIERHFDVAALLFVFLLVGGFVAIRFF